MIPKVSIVILNWNGLHDTLECLASLKHIDYPNYEVILVDNCSDGDDVKVISEQYGKYIAKIIVNEKNLGFSAGNNVGIKYALQNGADYVTLLNNDTIVTENFLSQIFKIKFPTENIGIFTPLINYYLFPTKVWCAGGYISRIRASGFSYGVDQDERMFLSNRLCSFASGCCMIIKKEVFNRIGYFDENYFLYLEDTDYCARTTKAGYQIKFIGSSKIFHKASATTTKNNSLLPIYYGLRNRLYFAKKNLAGFYYPALVYILIAFVFKSLVKMDFGINGVKLLFGATQDYFSNRMGKSRYF